MLKRRGISENAERMSNRVINISDVATAAGVSMKTVSRVINHEPNVRAKTKIAVQEAIKELGYTPSIMARSLAGKKSFCINMLCRTPRSDYFTELQFGALHVCQERGYHLLVSLIEDYHEISTSEFIERLKALISQPRPDAVIAPPPFCDDPALIRFLAEEDIKCVRISPYCDFQDGPYVLFDEEQAAYDMTKYLIDLGHERIGFIKGNPSHGSAKLRANGYEKALRDFGLRYDPEIALTGDFHFESGLEIGHQMLSNSDRPTAIFASNDEMAAGAAVAAQKAGLRLPEDISIAGFDDTAVSRVTWPRLTTVRQPLREMAIEAADYATRPLIVDHTKPFKKQTPKPYELIIRESTQSRR